MRLFYQFWGGHLNGTTMVRSEVELLAEGHTPDRSSERLAGMLVARRELDNQPKVSGYLGPMWDGERYLLEGGMMVDKFDWHDLSKVVEIVGVIRYETQATYDMLSM